MFDKVKAVAWSFASAMILAALTAALTVSETVDWGSFGVPGVIGGTVVGTGIAWGLAYWKKEHTFYSNKESEKP